MRWVPERSVQAGLCVLPAGTVEMVLWCCPAENRFRTAADPAGPAAGAAVTDCVAGVERIFLLGEYGIVSERKVWDNRSYGVPPSGGICTLPYDRVPSKSPPFCITLPSLLSAPSRWREGQLRSLSRPKPFWLFVRLYQKLPQKHRPLHTRKDPIKKDRHLGVALLLAAAPFPYLYRASGI